MNVPGAWSLTTGAENDVVVIVLDSGINAEHEEFRARIDSGETIVVDFGRNPDESPGGGWAEEEYGRDYFGHGTKVASVISAAHNGLGVMGIAPGASLIVGKITTCDSPDVCNTISVSIWLKAFEYIAEYATTNPSKRIIVNVSWDALFTPENVNFSYFEAAMADCFANHNVLFVAATGNSNSCFSDESPKPNVPGFASYPALFSSESHGYHNERIDDIVVAVGGTTFARESKVGGGYYHLPKAYDPTSYAAYGDTCKLVVDVSAPAGGGIDFGGCTGVNELGIYVAENTGVSQYVYAKGTSYAAPAVAGVAALTWAQHPSYQAEDLKRVLRGFAKNSTYVPDSWTNDPNIVGPHVSYGTDWGLHRGRGFRMNHEQSCPTSGVPNDPPEVWPTGASKSSSGAVDYDAWCSPAMGSGTPDTYLLVTQYAEGLIYKVAGGVLTEDIIIDDAQYVQMFGDIVIPDGITMRISPTSSGSGAVQVGVMGVDGINLGIDPDNIEIIIQDGGRLELVGDVDFRSHKSVKPEEERSWSGIQVESGGFLGYIAPETGGELSLFSTLGGLDLQSDLCVFSDVYVETTGLGVRVGGSVVFESLTVSGTPEIACAIDSTGTLNVGGFVDVESLDSFQAGIGIYLTGGASMETPSVKVGGFAYGINLDSVTGAVLESNVEISNCSIHGILVENSGGVQLSGYVLVEDIAQDGVRIQDSVGVLLSNLDIVRCSGSGIGVRGFSGGNLRNSEIDASFCGVFVGMNSSFDLGTANYQDWGNNFFQEIAGFDVASLNPSITLSADGNLWTGKHGAVVCSPLPAKILGSVSTVCQ